MPAESSSRTLTVVDDTDPFLGELSEVPVAPPGLIDTLDKVRDPRARRGIRHSIRSILAVALAATLTGARSFTAIAEWASDAGPERLAQLGVTGTVPSESTIRRTLQRLDADTVDAVLGPWMLLRSSSIGERTVIAYDGKTLRGSRDAAGNLVHLLAGLVHGIGTVVGQVAVRAKTNEIPLLPALLATMTLTDVIVTADAMHTQHGTARHIITRGGHYVLTVKNNQPLLRRALKALPWNDNEHTIEIAEPRSHGRTERRKIRVLDIADKDLFPHATRVLQLTRHTRRGRGATARRTLEVLYVITSVSAADASPAQVASWLRGHWEIENRLHWVRDVTFDEDRCRAATLAGAQVLATLRNTAISLIRLTGGTAIARTLRHHSRDPNRPITLLLTS